MDTFQIDLVEGEYDMILLDLSEMLLDLAKSGNYSKTLLIATLINKLLKGEWKR